VSEEPSAAAPEERSAPRARWLAFAALQVVLLPFAALFAYRHLFSWFLSTTTRDI